MEDHRKLEDCMVLEGYWCSTAIKIAIFNADMTEQVEYFSERLVDAVCFGATEVNELRGGVSWANALDKEAVELLNSEDEILLADRVEATARRLVHHAGRIALQQVKTDHRRSILRIKRRMDTKRLWQQALSHVE
jgi:hypothetical protein